MKPLLTMLAVVLSITICAAQQDTIVTYKNERLALSTKETATFIVKFFKSGKVWRKTTYHIQFKRKFYEDVFSENKDVDSKMILHKTYNEKGILYNADNFENSLLVSSICYYANGKINGEAKFDKSGAIIYQKGYDVAGKELVGYIFSRESVFEDGQQAWLRYLARHLNSDIVSINSAPIGVYTVIVVFIIDKEGNVTNVTAENDPGYGSKQEAIKVIERSPKWLPAIYNGKPILSRKKQPITFTVSAN
jgi:hypothetical protein